jgi:hypothetical protein
MSDFELRGPDPRIVSALRELHAPPGAGAYWAGLEERIMARITQAEGAWWAELGRWARPALLAAAAALAAAGLALFRTRDRATQVAYEAVLAAPTPISLRGTARPANLQGLQGEREETLRFLISY